jgi:hypothetical protein
VLQAFRKFAKGKREWADVLEILHAGKRKDGATASAEKSAARIVEQLFLWTAVAGLPLLGLR